MAPVPPALPEATRAVTALGVSTILMLKDPHGWKLTVPPQKRFCSCNRHGTKAGRGRAGGRRRKVKSLGTTLRQADPHGTCASRLQSDNRQCPDYGNEFSIVHQIV